MSPVFGFRKFVFVFLVLTQMPHRISFLFMSWVLPRKNSRPTLGRRCGGIRRQRDRQSKFHPNIFVCVCVVVKLTYGRCDICGRLTTATYVLHIGSNATSYFLSFHVVGATLQNSLFSFSQRCGGKSLCAGFQCAPENNAPNEHRGMCLFFLGTCITMQLQICPIANLPHCKFAPLQICTIANLHNCKFAPLQFCKIANCNNCKFAPLQIYIVLLHKFCRLRAGQYGVGLKVCVVMWSLWQRL